MTSSLGKPCPVLNNKHCLECSEVEKEWYTNRLLEDLAIVKGYTNYCGDWKFEQGDFRDLKVECKDIGVESENLNDRETCWLFLLLKGQDVNQISKKFNLSIKTVTRSLSTTLYKYVKVFTDKKISNWAQVRLYLEINGGYRKTNQPSVEQEQLGIKLTIPEKMSKDSIIYLINKINKLIDGSLSIELINNSLTIEVIDENL